MFWQGSRWLLRSELPVGGVQHPLQPGCITSWWPGVNLVLPQTHRWSTECQLGLSVSQESEMSHHMSSAFLELHTPIGFCIYSSKENYWDHGLHPARSTGNAPMQSSYCLISQQHSNQIITLFFLKYIFHMTLRKVHALGFTGFWFTDRLGIFVDSFLSEISKCWNIPRHSCQLFLCLHLLCWISL